MLEMCDSIDFTHFCETSIAVRKSSEGKYYICTGGLLLIRASRDTIWRRRILRDRRICVGNVLLRQALASTSVHGKIIP